MRENEMREILFRGKRKDNGEWIYGMLISFPEGKSFILSKETLLRCKYCDIDIVSCIILPETRGEYTGLTDKNGVKIFEGDCIRELFCDSIGVIRYGEYRQPFNDDKFTAHIGFYADWVSRENKEILRKDLGYWIKCGVVVIGNIHDNPELLEGDGDETD